MLFQLLCQRCLLLCAMFLHLLLGLLSQSIWLRFLWNLLVISREIPVSSVGPVKASSTVFASDDLDVSLGALLSSLLFFLLLFLTKVRVAPLPGDAEPENRKQQGSSRDAGGEFQKSSPRFSGILSGFGHTFGTQGFSPPFKRGKCII